MIFINPGTETIENASLENAITNMSALVTDINSKHRIEYLYQEESNYGGGRYCFLLLDYDNHSSCEIQMPGVPMSESRYMQENGQDIRDFLQLYVDGDSWFWDAAVDILRSEFSREAEDRNDFVIEIFEEH